MSMKITNNDNYIISVTQNMNGATTQDAPV